MTKPFLTLAQLSPCLYSLLSNAVNRNVGCVNIPILLQIVENYYKTGNKFLFLFCQGSVCHSVDIVSSGFDRCWSNYSVKESQTYIWTLGHNYAIMLNSFGTNVRFSINIFKNNIFIRITASAAYSASLAFELFTYPPN